MLNEDTAGLDQHGFVLFQELLCDGNTVDCQGHSDSARLAELVMDQMFAHHRYLEISSAHPPKLSDFQRFG